MSEIPAAASAVRVRPPKLRGTEQVVFLLGAFVVLALQALLLARVQEAWVPGPDAPPSLQFVSLSGTPDGAGILWINVEYKAFNPPNSRISQGVDVEIRLRNNDREPRTLRLRSRAGGPVLATWSAVPAAGEAGQKVTLPPGSYILEDATDPRRQTIIESQ